VGALLKLERKQEQLEAQLRDCRLVIGVGGIGTGICFELQDNHDLGRNESRAGYLVDARDYCKLHIIMHYLATLLRSELPERAVHLVPVGKVGSDAAGTQLLFEMETNGLDVEHIETVADAPTLFSVCFQYPDGSGGNITASNSAASKVTSEDVDRTRRLFEENRSRTLALAVPEVPVNVREHLIRVATEYGAFRVGAFTASELHALQNSDWLSLFDLIALNEEEASALAEDEFNPLAPDRFLERCSSTVRCSDKQTLIVITAGKHGAFGFDGERWTHSPAVSANVLSTAGAGDALLAGTLAALMMGAPFTNEERFKEVNSALDFGCLFASYSTTSKHTIHPNAGLHDVHAFARASGLALDRLRNFGAAVN